VAPRIGMTAEISTSRRAEGFRPSVSAVVPTRDRPALLLRALEAIRRQRYGGEIECVVVFDQADEAILPLDTVPHMTIRTISNTRSPGLAGARNTGILAAHGDLVAFCDDDDEWLPNKLAVQTDLMRSTAAVTVSSGICIRHGRQEHARVPPADAVTFRDLLRSRRMELHPSTIVVEREALLSRIGLIDEAIPGSYAEDYEWLLRAAHVQPIAAVCAPLTRVHWHESSFFAARWEVIVSALTYLLERYPEFASERAGLARICGQLAFASAGCDRPSDALRWAGRALRLSPFQPRAYLALAVSLGIATPDQVLRLARVFGRGV
jgi:glycosyltransferase involved in cell wall biosynthesis